VRLRLRELAAYFAARIGCGVDVYVPLTVHQIPGLSVGELGGTLKRAGKGLALLRIQIATPAFLPASAGP